MIDGIELARTVSFPRGDHDVLKHMLKQSDSWALNNLKLLCTELDGFSIVWSESRTFSSLADTYETLVASSEMRPFRDPYLLAWIYRCAVLLKCLRIGERNAESLIEHALSLVTMSIAVLSWQEKERLDITSLTIPRNQNVSILGTAWLLRSEETITASARVESEYVDVRRDENSLLTIGCEGSTNECVANSNTIQVVERYYHKNYGFELASAVEFPEIGDERITDFKYRKHDIDLECDVDRAMTLIRATWPKMYDEVVLFCRVMCAVVPPESQGFTGTFSRIPFLMTVTIREQQNAVELAEAIIHEAAHVKINLYDSVNSLILQPDRHVYIHAWRDIPRPMRQVVWAAHTFVGILSFYVRYLRKTGEEWVYYRIREDLPKVSAAIDTAKRHDALTKNGKEFLEILEQDFDEVSSNFSS